MQFPPLSLLTPAAPLPESIPDTLENVIRALVTTPQQKREDWDYLKRTTKKEGKE